MTNPCLFCRSTTNKITKEHVWGQWLRDLFPGERDAAYKLIREDNASPIFFRKPFDLEVRVVCEKCNNGWMEDMESAVRPFLGPMIQAEQVTALSPDSQYSLAAWATKTALMLQDFKTGHRIVPDSEYHRFYVAKQPAPGYLVLVGRDIIKQNSAGQKILTISGTRFMPRMKILLPGNDPRVTDAAKGLQSGKYCAFNTTFVVGPVVFLVVGHNLPIPAIPNLSLHRLVDRAVRIWPIDKPALVTWPPKLRFEIWRP
jgi:hypothetical protein